MAWLGAHMPVSSALGAYNRVTDIAVSLQGQDESRTLTQLRADVFADLLLDGVILPAGQQTEALAGRSGASDSQSGASDGRSSTSEGRQAVPKRSRPDRLSDRRPAGWGPGFGRGCSSRSRC